MEYFSGMKRNKVQLHVITLMKLENIMLNEKPSVGHIFCMIALYEIFTIDRPMEKESWWVVKKLGKRGLKANW